MNQKLSAGALGALLFGVAIPLLAYQLFGWPESTVTIVSIAAGGLLVGAVLGLLFPRALVFGDETVSPVAAASQASPAAASGFDAFVAAWRSKHARTAWRPVAAGDDRSSRSWFGGGALVADASDWPSCSECGEPMRFFLQLDLAGLPAGAPSPGTSGLVQLFYCQTDDGMCETWEPFSGTSEVRWVQGRAELAEVDGPKPLARQAIVAWQRCDDWPNHEEFGELGLRVDYDADSRTQHLRCDEPRFDRDGMGLDVTDALPTAVDGDKLGGWPAWVQGPEYPSCPTCGERMELLFQLDSQDNLPYMFGDAGCGHITFCRSHPEQLTFAWACH